MGWLDDIGKAEEGMSLGSAPAPATEEYAIKKADTLSQIANKFKVPLATLAAENKLNNPNQIIEGKTLKIPTKFNRELKFNEIPTTDNKKVVIDNFSKHYDYILEGDKLYYKVKGGKSWADVSDNEKAKTNIVKFLDKNNYWAGYGSGEKEKYLGKAPIKTSTLAKSKNLVQPNKTKNTSETILPIKYLSDKNKKTPSVGDIVSSTATEIKNSVSSGFNTAVQSTGDLMQTLKNGIARKFSTYTGIDEDGRVEESKVPKTVKEYYSRPATNIQVLDAKGAPGRQFKQQTLEANEVQFGYRNRGDYKNIENTDGLEVTAFHPFTKNKLPDKTSVLALDEKGKLHTGTYGEFKNKPGYVFSKTFKNNIVDFATDNSGKVKYLEGERSGNPQYKQPGIKVLNDKGKVVEGALNILVKDPNKKDFYGSIQGGRILFVDPTTKKQFLVSGSADHIQKEFKRLKGNNKYLEAYSLDNGTYSRGLSYKDKKLTPERLKSYDLENTSGGNGLYIKTYNKPVNKYQEEYLQTPNIRTEKDASYKRGHKLKNEIKNIVLHHTAYMDPVTNDEALKKQYMTPGSNTSHVVIEEDGRRMVYASPEQVTFHAGKSKWKNREDVNDFGIGVEFQGDTNVKPLTRQQVESFVEYYAPLAKKYNLSLKDIITHQMIAPGRKPDITNAEYARILKYMKHKGYKEDGGTLPSYQNGGWLDGLTNEGFNYNGAWGGPAQNGGELITPELPKELIDKALAYQEGWQNSPMYERMLDKSSANPAEFKDIGDKRWKALGTTAFDKYATNFPDSRLGEATDTGHISISPKALNRKSVYDHELSHVTDTVKTPEGMTEVYIPEKDMKSISKHKRGLDMNEYNKYLLEPTEVRARINSIRANAKDEGIYDPFTEKMSRSQFKKAQKSSDQSAILDMIDVYGKNKTLKLINSISDASADDSNNFIAQNGSSMPGSVGFSYARTGAPSNGKYAKKTMPSAQDGLQVFGPRQKRGVELLLKETARANRDKKELQTTGNIKNPRSIAYKNKVNTAPEIHQDTKTDEQRRRDIEAMQKVHESNLTFERPLLYLSSPDKILGDIGIPGFEGTEKNREEIMLNRYSPYQSDSQRMKNSLLMASKELPFAALNLGMGIGAAAEGRVGGASLRRALAEAYNPVPLPYEMGMKDMSDFFRRTENYSDTAGIIDNVSPTVEATKNFDWKAFDHPLDFESLADESMEAAQKYDLGDYDIDSKVVELAPTERFDFRDLEEIKNKHRADFEKEFGTRYSEKDLGIYAKEKELAEERLRSTTSYLTGGKQTKSDEFARKHGLKRDYTMAEELYTDAYTRGYDSVLNNRSYEYNEDVDKLYAGIREQFEEAIKKTKLKEAEELYRGDKDYAMQHVWRGGVKQPPGSIRYSELQEGDEWEPNSFMSTSIDEGTAATFGDLRSVISAPPGQSVLFPNATGVQNFSTELEAILPQYLKFKVDKVNDTSIAKKFTSIDEIPEGWSNEVYKKEDGILKYKYTDSELPSSEYNDMHLMTINSTLNLGKGQKYRHSIMNPYMTLPLMGLGAAGSAATSDKKRSGGVIKDNRGQRKYPGEITEISGDTMATDGYGDIPLYVVPDKGAPRLVMPNTGTHKFRGASKFTEYPVRAKDGNQLTKLDQLTNFTNYNTPQPGGWLDNL